MGFLDFLLTKPQKQRKVATRIGVESGLFTVCPVCHGVTEMKDPHNYQVATNELIHRMVREHHPDAGLFDLDAAEMRKSVDQVAKDLPYHCLCEDN